MKLMGMMMGDSPGSWEMRLEFLRGPGPRMREQVGAAFGRIGWAWDAEWSRLSMGVDMRLVSLALSAAAIVVALLGGAAAGLVGVGAVLATSASSDCAIRRTRWPTRPTTRGWWTTARRCWRRGTHLAGSATLNWSADTPITEWEGVAVGGSAAAGYGAAPQQQTADG